MAWELSETLHGRTATPPLCAIMLVLFFVVNTDLLSNELSRAAAMELVSVGQRELQRRLKLWECSCATVNWIFYVIDSILMRMRVVYRVFRIVIGRLTTRILMKFIFN